LATTMRHKSLHQKQTEVQVWCQAATDLL